MNAKSNKKPEDATVSLIENREMKQLLEMKSSEQLWNKDFYRNGEEGLLEQYFSDKLNSLDPFEEVPMLMSSGAHYTKSDKDRILGQGHDDGNTPVFLAYPDNNLFLLKQELEYGMGIIDQEPTFPKDMPKPLEFEVELFSQEESKPQQESKSLATAAMDNIAKQITAIHEAREEYEKLPNESTKKHLKKALMLTAKDIKELENSLNELDKDKTNDLRVDILATLHNELKQAERVIHKNSKKDYASTEQVGLNALKAAASSQNLTTIGPELQRMTACAKEVSRQTMGILEKSVQNFSSVQMRNVITQLVNAKKAMKCGFFESKDAFKVRQESMDTIIEKVRLVFQERELLQDQKYKNEGGGVGRTRG